VVYQVIFHECIYWMVYKICKLLGRSLRYGDYNVPGMLHALSFIFHPSNFNPFFTQYILTLVGPWRVTSSIFVDSWIDLHVLNECIHDIIIWFVEKGQVLVMWWAGLQVLSPPSPALMRACSGLRPSFRFRKPKPGAQAQASTPCGLVWGPQLEV
jgi:hypothetical protein